MPKKIVWRRLERASKSGQRTAKRRRRVNTREAKVVERGFENLRLNGEDVAGFVYSPTHCKNKYRMVVLRKNLAILKGEKCLLDDVRYFFYPTNDTAAPAFEIVREANQRCNQERLLSQLHSGVRATTMPVDNLVSNWAYMGMAALAWSLKAWFALLLPEGGRWASRYRREEFAVLKMEFRTLLNAFIRIPAQLVRTGRRRICRLLAWNRWQEVFLRGTDQLVGCLRS